MSIIQGFSNSSQAEGFKIENIIFLYNRPRNKDPRSKKAIISTFIRIIKELKFKHMLLTKQKLNWLNTETHNLCLWEQVGEIVGAKLEIFLDLSFVVVIVQNLDRFLKFPKK